MSSGTVRSSQSLGLVLTLRIAPTNPARYQTWEASPAVGSPKNLLMFRPLGNNVTCIERGSSAQGFIHCALYYLVLYYSTDRVQGCLESIFHQINILLNYIKLHSFAMGVLDAPTRSGACSRKWESYASHLGDLKNVRVISKREYLPTS